MTNTELGQQIARRFGARVTLANGRTRPTRIRDIQDAAKAVAREAGLARRDADQVYLAAQRESLNLGHSTAGFGR